MAMGQNLDTTIASAACGCSSPYRNGGIACISKYLQAAPCSKRHSSKQIWQVKRSFASCQEQKYHAATGRKMEEMGEPQPEDLEKSEKIHQDTSRCHIPSMFHTFHWSSAGHITDSNPFWAPSLPLRCRRIPAAWWDFTLPCCQIYCRIGLVRWNMLECEQVATFWFHFSPVPMAC